MAEEGAPAALLMGHCEFSGSPAPPGGASFLTGQPDIYISRGVHETRPDRPSEYEKLVTTRVRVISYMWLRVGLENPDERFEEFEV